MANAGDVTVSLSLDDKGFQRSIDNTITSVGNLGSKVAAETSRISSAFSGLKGAIAGLAIGKLVSDIGAGSLELVRFAKATGQTVSTLNSWKESIISLGGTLNNATDSIGDFSKNLGEAAQNGGDVLTAFNTLGIGLKDIQTLSEADILKKTISSLSELAKKDSFSAISVSAKIFGESLKGIPLDQLSSSIVKVTDEGNANAQATIKAAEAQKNFNVALDQFKQNLSLALAPLSEVFAAFAGNKDLISNLTQLIIGLGAAFIGLKAAQGAAAAIAILTTSVTGLELALKRVFIYIGLAITAFEALDWASKKVTGNSIGDWAKKAGESMGLVDSETKGAVDTTKKYADALTQADAASQSLEQSQNRRIEFFEKERRSLEETVKKFGESNGLQNERIARETKSVQATTAQKDAYEQLFDLELRRKQVVDELTAKLRESKDAAIQGEIKAAIAGINLAYDDQIKKINELLVLKEKETKDANFKKFAFESITDSLKKQVDLQAQLTGLKSNEGRGLTELQSQYQDLYKTMQDGALAAIRAEEQRRGLQAGTLPQEEQIKYINQATQAYEELKGKIKEVYDAETKRRELLAFDQEKVQVAKELRDIQYEMATMTMPEIEKKEWDIKRAAEERARAFIAAEEARTGVKMTNGEQQRIIDEYIAGTDELVQSTKKSYDMSRTWSTGWKQAMNDYVKSAGDGAAKAKSVFGKAMSGMEDLLVNFAKTGKFEWKNFVAMMLEELLRAQIQMIFAQMLGGMSDSMKTTGAGMLGGAGGGMGVLGALGGAAKGTNAGTSGLTGILSTAGDAWSSIKNFFSGENAPADGMGPTRPAGAGYTAATGIWDTVKSVGSGISDAVSGIGDFFGGFFADGGSLGAGKWGIAGESGPELIAGPANITPMDQMANSAAPSVTNVTYNINAVDALSFKQLLAQDPSYLYGLTMAGAKGVPARR